MRRKRGTSVVACDHTGKVIQRYRSIAHAARTIGVWPNAISTAIRSGYRAAGFWWREAECRGNFKGMYIEREDGLILAKAPVATKAESKMFYEHVRASGRYKGVGYKLKEIS